MKLTRILSLLGSVSVLVAGIVGCGGFVYTEVGGTVKGLPASSVMTLSTDTGYSSNVLSDGTFSFRVASNATYHITVTKQPLTANCTVVNGDGKMTSSTAVTNVVVTCLPNVPIGGTLTNLDTGKTLYLALNDERQAGLAANGAFVLTRYAIDGKPYVVKVDLPPASQVCSVINGTGVANISNLPAAKNLQVNCVAGVPIAGSVSGMASNTAIELANNVGDKVVLYSNGNFTFGFSLADGAGYDVQVSTQPKGQKCTVTNGHGTASLATPAPASNVVVTCIAA